MSKQTSKLYQSMANDAREQLATNDSNNYSQWAHHKQTAGTEVMLSSDSDVACGSTCSSGSLESEHPEDASNLCDLLKDRVLVIVVRLEEWLCLAGRGSCLLALLLCILAMFGCFLLALC